MKQKVNLKRDWKRGIALLDFLIYLAIIGAIVAAIFFILKPQATKITQTNELKTEYSTFMSGLKGYYSDNNIYPPSGFTWNENEAYLTKDLINKGWDYQCVNGNTIQITTPSIKNPKVMVKFYNSIKKTLEGTNANISKNGDKLVIQIPDSPCQS